MMMYKSLLPAQCFGHWSDLPQSLSGYTFLSKLSCPLFSTVSAPVFRCCLLGDCCCFCMLRASFCFHRSCSCCVLQCTHACPATGLQNMQCICSRVETGLSCVWVCLGVSFHLVYVIYLSLLHRLSGVMGLRACMGSHFTQGAS